MDIGTALIILITGMVVGGLITALAAMITANRAADRTAKYQRDRADRYQMEHANDQWQTVGSQCQTAGGQK